jgi:hypothetical protein
MSDRLAMFLGVLRFEWRYQTRQLTFAAAVAVMAALGAFLVSSGFGPSEVDVNSPYVVMFSFGLLSLVAVFVLTVFCAGAALRDVEHRMLEIVFVTPVGKPRFFLGRFVGVVLAGMSVMTVVAIVMLIAPFLMAIDPARVGPFQPTTYLWTLATLVLPNVLLVAALLFAIALLTRSAVATYVGGVAIYGLYWVAALLIDSPIMAGAGTPTPEGLARAALLDPLGLSAFFEQTRYWTPGEREVRLTSLTGHFLVNRLIWIGVAAMAIGLAYRRFALRLAPGARAAAPASPRADVPPPRTIYVPVIPGRGAWAAFGRAVQLELRHLFRGWTFLALLVLWTFVAGMEAFGQLGGGEYGTQVLPTAGILFDALQLPLLLLGSVAVVYYATEVAWRERLLGVDALIDATPTSTAVFYGAKVVALMLLPFVMALVAVMIATLVQLVIGATPVQVGVHSTLLWYGAVPVALLAVAALAFQALAPNRWIGLFAGLALAIVARRGESLGLEYPLLRYGGFPPVAHSAMDGFGAAPASFAAVALYWSSAAFLIGVLTWGIWRRGLDGGLRARVRRIRASWGRGGMTTATIAAVLFVLVGATLWRVSEANAPWESAATREKWRAEYERKYRYQYGAAQPEVIAVRTRVDLEPRAQRARVEGTYLFENRTPSTIDTIWVVVPRAATPEQLRLEGAAPAVVDARFQVYGFPLAPGMPPHGRLSLTFTSLVDEGGIRVQGPEYDITGDGTYLPSQTVYPSIGYRRFYEIPDPDRRRVLGLSPTATVPAGERAAWATLDAVVSTDTDQTALVTGTLVGRWDSAGRRYFHYVSEWPITPGFGLASARYAVRSATRAGVRLEVWYHPAHGANVDRILGAADRTLELLSARYGRYPGSVLRIAEVPSWAGFGGYAHSGLILFTEDRGFLADPRPSDVDLITRRVAHEVAHQWWGHQVDPIDGPGATILVETLTKYAEQQVIAAVHGDSAVPAMLAFEEDRYLVGRAGDGPKEPALFAAGAEQYLYYGKGAIAMHALAAVLGPAAIDRALARLVQEVGGPTGGGTTADLERLLLAEAHTPEQRNAVTEWLRRRVVDDYRVAAGTVAAGDSGYRTRFELTGRRGTSVDFTVYGGTSDAPTAIYVGRATVVDSLTQVSLLLRERPRSVVIDPDVRTIDQDRSNNRATFEGE